MNRMLNKLGRLMAVTLLVLCGTHGAIAQTEKPIEFGVLPNVSARILMQQYEPMQRFLDRKLPQKTAFSSASDWPRFYQRAASKQYDVVIAASNVGRLLEKDFGFRPILAYQPMVPGLFITLAGVDKSPSEILKGKTLALANPASLVALEGHSWLRSQGLVKDKDYQVIRVRGEDSVGNTLLRGDAAAGILSMGEFRSHPAEIRDRLLVHTRFKDVAGFLVLISPAVSKDLAEQIRQHLLALAQDESEGNAFFAKSGFKGIVTVSESELKHLDAFVDMTRAALQP